jgi:predicted  nucleic acid-binding Zn-ribbon protein
MASLTHAAAPARRIGRALAAGGLMLALVTTSTSGSTASPRSRLDAANDRLGGLTERIVSQQAQARSLQDRVSRLDARVTDVSSRVAGIDAELATTKHQLVVAAAHARKLQMQLDAMARSLFMQGAGSVQASMLGQLLGSSSIGDVGDLLVYGQAVGLSDVDLADRVANLRVELTREAADLDRLRLEQTQLLAQLVAERATQARAIAEQRAVLTDLERTRSQIVTLIASLHARIRSQALATVGAVFQGSGHISYGAWAGSFLRTMGAPSCRSNLVALVAWQYSEFTQAAWNPLADTLPMPGSTDFNSIGVQDYVSLGQGLQAVRHTLTNGPSLGYPAIVSALRDCADAMTTGRAINASAWCRGCAGGQYVTGVIAKVEGNYDLYARL